MSICQGINCFIANLFLVVKERESVLVLPCLPAPAPVSTAALLRCRTRPTRAQSSLQPLASAPLSLGYCTAAEKADETHHSHHQRRFLPTSHTAVPSTVCGRHLRPNLISNSVKRTLAHVLCLDYQVVSYTTTRQCVLF